MTGDYQLAESAESDLREILQYVAEKDGVDRALHVQARFIEAFEMLGLLPGVGSTRPELTGGLIRWWTVFRWIVLYDPATAPITILRVIHGARDMEHILSPSS